MSHCVRRNRCFPVQHSATTKEVSYSIETGEIGLCHLFGLGFFFNMSGKYGLAGRQISWDKLYLMTNSNINSFLCIAWLEYFTKWKASCVVSAAIDRWHRWKQVECISFCEKWQARVLLLLNSLQVKKVTYLVRIELMTRLKIKK